MRILIETIPHTEQRYPTAGDWWTDADGTWHIRVSELASWNCELLVAFHELIEMALCKQYGVDEDAVTRFDMSWRGLDDVVEPGDDIEAPYYHEHQIASGFERLLAAELGVPWHWYETAVDSL